LKAKFPQGRLVTRNSSAFTDRTLFYVYEVNVQ